ncbi:indolepyruvate oxidoreductase subunit beta [Geobacter sp. FeAm09]|uniref:indolepyruvate oxidoreductase subunit beta n=1 Tax=Geobacter sp. FeAm09 TaxID=2597769 RepID=UPI0011F05997|nr:indolepyruvate oxidoreductase subunit beta [Geobacter sp. FeAm09]QEM68630.1 indolepyruvate oxidoreductase subunit beta [Geobacter sp. FeAm09]
MISQQLIISGVGGQGILFITRLLAETAIAMGLPVLTSETHGMAQRGGIVISHLKVGDFSSPLVRPGQADGLIALKPGNVPLHRPFLRPDGWIAANAGASDSLAEAATIDADAIALRLGNPQAVNLIVLGRALATGRLFCTIDELDRAIRRKLHAKPAVLEGALAALGAGSGAA